MPKCPTVGRQNPHRGRQARTTTPNTSGNHNTRFGSRARDSSKVWFLYSGSTAVYSVPLRGAHTLACSPLPTALYSTLVSKPLSDL